MKKTTEELFSEITDSDTPESFINENSEELVNLSLSEFLKVKLAEYNKKKSDIFKSAGMEGSNYGYELFRNDNKVPSRNILLAICIAFPLCLEETQMALRCAGLALLYPRDARDAYLIYAIKNAMTLEEVDELLESHGLDSIL